MYIAIHEYSQIYTNKMQNEFQLHAAMFYDSLESWLDAKP